MKTTLELDTTFFYHYKHDPQGPVNNYAYEALNIGHHTEVKGLEESKMVAYRPLYPEAGVYQAGFHWDFRPYEMFTGTVEKDGKTIKRFTEITDGEVIKQLVAIRNQLYFGKEGEKKALE